MRFSLATVALLAAPALARPWGGDDAGLNLLARRRWKYWFGTAADIPGPEQQDDPYMDILVNNRNWGEITPANYMKVSLLSQYFFFWVTC